MRTILFICTGNTCRSPMAEAIARAHIAQEGPEVWGEVFIASAGTAAIEGVPSSRETVEAINRLGIEFDGRSRPLTKKMIKNADFILCMTDSHAQQVRQMIDPVCDQLTKVSTLDPERDITDPIGLPQKVYDKLAGELRELIPRRLEELLQK